MLWLLLVPLERVVVMASNAGRLRLCCWPRRTAYSVLDPLRAVLAWLVCARCGPLVERQLQGPRKPTGANCIGKCRIQDELTGICVAVSKEPYQPYGEAGNVYMRVRF
jgi:hypothetical protein